jgi:radical SAM/Cys-rich protein
MRNNSFETIIEPLTGGGLTSWGLDTFQVNLGLYCNQSCSHCHLLSSPSRNEQMDWKTMELIIHAARKVSPGLIDITGGAPELNPYFRKFIQVLNDEGIPLQVRTNLTVMLEDGKKDLPQFFQDNGVHLVASLPCYLEENVVSQRGGGVYEKSVAALMILNENGYGVPGGLPLNLVYNPGGPFLPPPQKALESEYREKLKAKFGISFTSLITITNMPIGRFLSRLKKDEEIDGYRKLLKESFNPETIEGLMCRHLISIGWDGRIYDCDFNLALSMGVDHGAPDHISRFDPDALGARRIVTGEHCFGCTAGFGSSCGGALVNGGRGNEGK